MVLNVLYKRGYSLPYLRCLSSAEAAYVLAEVHEWVCENYLGGYSLAQKILRQGYFWPTMKKDAQSYMKKLQEVSRIHCRPKAPADKAYPNHGPIVIW